MGNNISPTRYDMKARLHVGRFYGLPLACIRTRLSETRATYARAINAIREVRRVLMVVDDLAES